MPTTKQTKRSPKKPQPVVPMELDGRIPPQAPDFEEAVLGAILLEKDAYARVSEKIRPETFYVKAHELIYTAMVTLAMAQQPMRRSSSVTVSMSMGCCAMASVTMAV